MLCRHTWKTIKNRTWDGRTIKKYWFEQVGGAQLMLPMHVIQEYCHPKRPFGPCPDFTSSDLIRELPNWLKVSGLGSSQQGLWRDWRPICTDVPDDKTEVEVVACDRKALIALYEVRVKQREELISELISSYKYSI